MVAFACLCALIDLSTLYSPAPLVTGVAALAMTAYFGFSCVLVSTIPERTLTLCLFWALSVTCIVSTLSVVLVPDMAFGHNDADALAGGHRMVVEQVRLQGLFGQPNILARYVSVFAYITLAVAYRGYIRPLIWVPNALMVIGLLFATQSRGTIVAAVAAALLLIPRRYLVILLALGVVGGVSLSMSGTLPLLLAMVGRNGDANEAVDMAGRADLWQFVWQLIGQRPLLGYGFNSFEVFAGPLWTGQAQAGVGAHNNYLSMLYSNGLIGMIPFATGFVILLRRWMYEPDPPRDFFVISTLVYGYTEMDVPSFAAVPSQLFFTMIALDCVRRFSLGSVAARRGGPDAILTRARESPT
jgi:O-antigen ligase